MTVHAHHSCKPLPYDVSRLHTQNISVSVSQVAYPALENVKRINYLELSTKQCFVTSKTANINKWIEEN
jgi:hypothetical protein